jgi:hypothetical protein
MKDMLKRVSSHLEEYFPFDRAIQDFHHLLGQHTETGLFFDEDIRVIFKPIHINQNVILKPVFRFFQCYEDSETCQIRVILEVKEPEGIAIGKINPTCYVRVCYNEKNELTHMTFYFSAWNPFYTIKRIK